MPCRRSSFALVAAWLVVGMGGPALSQGADQPLQLHLQSRVTTEPGKFQVVPKRANWDPAKTALIVCDMWDQHWCRGATRRVAEMAPRMNELLKAARRQGVLVIHCPSGTMDFYRGTPQRKLAQAAPPVELKSLPAGWCPLADGSEPPLPFDNSRDQCDCSPQCERRNPYRRQVATLQIADEDAITDSDEAYFLMRERGIENVIVLGVHANMCILGRPFSIRKMCLLGQNVVLVRDMTDCMHDSQSPPAGLDHFRANELIVEHIEKYWCPTIASVDFLSGAPFAFREDRRPHVAFVVGEDEYQTSATLPAFAEAELAARGLRCTFVHADPGDPNSFPGLAAVRSADLVVVSVRRRTPPDAQLALVREYVAAGKPVVGIRTASHAFSLRNNQPPPAGHAAWPEFDAQVLGGHYTGHHDNQDGKPPAFVWRDPAADEHVVLRGVPRGEQAVLGSLYRTSPLAPSTTTLMWGRVEGQRQNEPVAWTNKTAAGARVFYTSLGHASDFAVPAFRRLLTGGIFWALGKPVPDAAAQTGR